MLSSPNASFPVGHQMILASAGSGKTHDLTTRFFTLMVSGVAPEKIIALTFSKKSAGEFFGRILRRLAEAAGSESSAAALDEAIRQQEKIHYAHLGETPPDDRPALTQDAATALLVTLVKRLNLLTLGTMDSFFIRMAKSFPLELGLSGDFGILDSQLEVAARQRIYNKIFQPNPAHVTDQQDFIAAFQQATHGKEEVSLVRNLDEFIKECNGYFSEARRSEIWGQPSVIWKDGGAPRDPGVSLTVAASAALELLDSGKHPLSSAQAEALRPYLEEMLTHSPFNALPATVRTVIKKLAEEYDALANGSAAIMLSRKEVELGPLLCDKIRDVLDAQIYADFSTGWKQIQGIWRILNRYEQNYDILVRQQGQLTFADVQLLLSGDLASPEDGGSFAMNRELLEFRLDAQFDHWLLDEFQDTNGRQWGILSNLIDEVIQDDTGLRTFFAVGDVKQAIHMWRGSDPDLMGRLLKRYNNVSDGLPDRIATLSKAVSWRCAPDVLKLANAALSDRERLSAWLPAGTLQDAWNFEPHHSAPNVAGRTGFSEVLVVQPRKDDKSKDAKDEDSLTVLCERLRELQPLERRLTCAVLVMSNRQAVEVAEFIRAHTGLTVSCESDASVVNEDNACAGLLDLLRMAAHPANSFAEQHLEMSPWRLVAETRTKGDPQYVLKNAAEFVRRQTVQEGVAAVIRYWVDGLRAVEPELPAYSSNRLGELASLAAEFDATGNRDLDEFIAVAEAQTMRDTSSASSIHVMTVYKAKGLEWDIVFATGFHEQKHGGVFDDTAVQYNNEREIEWITKVPNKDLAVLNPTIKAMDEARNRWRWRQNICLLYVLLTRAKRSTHVILRQPGESSEAKRLDILLMEMLAGEDAEMISFDEIQANQIWSSGSMAWVDESPVKSPSASAPSMQTKPKRVPPKSPRLLRRRPSDQPVRSYFSLDRQRALQQGDAVHQVLSKISWWDDAHQPELNSLVQNLPRELQRETINQLQWSLMNPSVAGIFRLPVAGNVKLWLEKAFDFVMNGTHVSGVMDRVLIHRDSSGNCARADVYDFKTDSIDHKRGVATLVKQYTGQMEEYRSATAKLLALPRSAVAAHLVFLSNGHVETIPVA